MTVCSRCGEEKDRWVPLDAVVHAHEGPVCEDCVEPWDEVVDV